MISRIKGLFLRYAYLYKHNVSRLGDLFFWPVMELVVWGLLTVYLQRDNAANSAVLFLLGGVIFWDVLYRAQQAITLSFSEEIWARNLVNVFITPISIFEFTLATALIGTVRAGVGFSVLAILAWALYAFNIFALGFSLLPFLACLMLFGWAVGMGTMGLILRWGKSAEILVWGVPFIFQPVVCVFYPVDVLPSWLQPIAYVIPATHVFEGMRGVLYNGTFDLTSLGLAFGLNIVWLGIGITFLSYMLKRVRELGYLGKMGME